MRLGFPTVGEFRRLAFLTLSPPECLMEFCNVTLTFDSVDKILRCDHSNETSLTVLSHGAICFSKFHKMKFGNLVEICFWLNLAVKGLKIRRDKKQNGDWSTASVSGIVTWHAPVSF